MNVLTATTDQRAAAGFGGLARFRALSFRNLYATALAFWLLTRWLVLVHQGAWPWMNAFVVAAARGMVVGDWNDAVRPQLPAVLGVPLVLVGATEQQTVAVLYVVASIIQFVAFVGLVRALFSGQLREQALALLVFLLLPINHSIHHYRDVPVVLASASVFLLAAAFVAQFRPAALLSAHPRPSVSRKPNRAGREVSRTRRVVAARSGRAQPWRSEGSLAEAAVLPSDSSKATRAGAARLSRGRVALIFGAMLLGVWSRAEVLTFVAVIILLGLLVFRRRAVRLALTYATAAAVVSGSLLLVYRLEGVDLAEASLYQAHTFLDSTPDSWLTPECRANPTENCREADGLTYFGPADLHAGVLPLVLGHPLAAIAKTARSAFDNLWILLGPNLSTFPGIVPFLVIAFALVQPARDRLRQVSTAVWIAVAGVLAESVLPPLSWAPPHPQYHLQLVFPIVMLVVLVLQPLWLMQRGRLVALAFLAADVGLSALRYTRYAGY